jgi:site-specific DNA-adenine methylase
MEQVAVIWNCNEQSEFIQNMTSDELYLFDADIRDAIDGVIEDWEGK